MFVWIQLKHKPNKDNLTREPMVFWTRGKSQPESKFADFSPALRRRIHKFSLAGQEEEHEKVFLQSLTIPTPPQALFTLNNIMKTESTPPSRTPPPLSARLSPAARI